MFAHGQIAMQIFLVNTPKRTQKIARGRPQTFDGVGMHLTDAVAIIISCPFFLAVTHCVVLTIDSIVALPLIRVTGGFFFGVAMYVFLQRLSIGMSVHAQPALPTFSAYGPDDGRTIILIGPVTSSLVRAAARRIARVAVFVAFFPPRSETSHQFPSPRQVTSVDPTSCIRWLGAVCATDGRTGAKARVLQLIPSPVRLCKSRALTTPHGIASDCCLQRGFPYRGYRSVGSGDSGNRQSPACASETPVPLALTLHIPGTASLGGENVSLPMRYSHAHPGARLWGKSLPTFTIECTD